MIRAIYFDDGPASRFSSLALSAPAPFLHTPILCILKGTEPTVADFKIPSHSSAITVVLSTVVNALIGSVPGATA